MSGTAIDPHMPNGDCGCGEVPWRHLDTNGHVPTCANWTHDMLWQERLAHNLAVVVGLYAAWCNGFVFNRIGY